MSETIAGWSVLEWLFGGNDGSEQSSRINGLDSRSTGSARRPVRAVDNARHDAERMARVRDGDSTAFTELVQAHYATMLGIARAMLPAADNAQDAVQNVFMRLWLQRAELQIRGDLRGYLWRAVQNEARLLLRRENVRERYVVTSQQAEALTVRSATNLAPEALEREELARQVHAVLATLPRRCREIFVLYWGDGLTPDEIAGVFGISHRTVQNQIAAAYRALTQRLDLL